MSQPIYPGNVPYFVTGLVSTQAISHAPALQYGKPIFVTLKYPSDSEDQDVIVQ